MVATRRWSYFVFLQCILWHRGEGLGTISRIRVQRIVFPQPSRIDVETRRFFEDFKTCATEVLAGESEFFTILDRIWGVVCMPRPLAAVTLVIAWCGEQMQAPHSTFTGHQLMSLLTHGLIVSGIQPPCNVSGHVIRSPCVYKPCCRGPQFAYHISVAMWLYSCRCSAGRCPIGARSAGRWPKVCT